MKQKLARLKKYGSFTDSYCFVPVAIETFGVWGDMGMEFIKEVGRKIMEQTGEKRATSFLFQSIGVAVQRGNSLSVLGTLKQEENSLDEIFLL